LIVLIVVLGFSTVECEDDDENDLQERTQIR